MKCEIAKDETLRNVQYQMDTGSYDLNSLSDDQRRVAYYLLDLVKTDVDNEHYQYQNGFLERDFYDGVTVPMIKHYGPLWREIGLSEGRPTFRQEVERILGQAE